MRRPLQFARALALAAVVAVAGATTASAASLGYGTFLGEFSKKGGKNPDADMIEDLLTPELFTELDLDPAGKWEGGKSSGGLAFAMTEFKDKKGKEAIGGTWTYLGFPAGEGPGNGPIDLFLAVKYGSLFSLFLYEYVLPGDTGQFASSPALSGAGQSTNKKGIPYAISNIQGFWPPAAQPSAVPVPAAVWLLGTALVGLFAGGRLRRRQTARS